MINWCLEVFDELPSTSDYCVAAAKNGEPEGLAVLARRQTAGRGSRGRQWVAPEGNLNLSVLLRPQRPAASAGMFSLMGGLAVAQALAPFGLPQMHLKWPNDVLVEAGKIAGVLTDAQVMDGHFEWLVIGIGVNIASAPEIAGRQTTSLAVQGTQVGALHLAEKILAALADWYVAPDTKVAAAWQALAHPLGTALRVQGGGLDVQGTYAGLTSSGELQLNVGGELRTISTGEILLGTG